MKKVLIIDTSILCVWLQVPGMDVCGPDNDRWDRDKVQQKITEEMKKGSVFVLPIATIIETGNHISRADHSRKERAEALSDILRKSADGASPWAAFSAQTELWKGDKLKNLATDWPNLATQGLSLGDVTIKDVAEYYAQMNHRVEILTGDKGLKSYEPVQGMEVPRRRRSQ